VSLRKSPTMTPALLASNRLNAKKSTGPRTALGKARSRLNHFRHGMRSPDFIKFFKAVHDAPLGEVGKTADTLLASQLVVHPLFTHIAEAWVDADVEMCNELRARSRRKREKKGKLARSKPECYWKHRMRITVCQNVIEIKSG